MGPWAVALVLFVSLSLNAQPTRTGPKTGVNPDPPIIQPKGTHSFIVDDNGNKIWDSQLSNYFFTNKSTSFASYNQALFTIEACHSGGFIGSLATYDGNENQLNTPANIRPNVVVNTACAYSQCSFYAAGTAAKNYTDAYSYFPHYWQSEVANNAMGDVTMQTAFQNSSAATVAVSPQQSPQYYASSNLANSFTLRYLRGFDDYAFLFGVGGNNNVGWEFFNDIQNMRNVLINNYGWDASHIIVMYDGGPRGTLPDGVTPVPNWVDYSATTAGLKDALESVHDDTTSLSKIFWFSTSHGDSATPEPGTLTLLGTGVVGLTTILRKKWNAHS